MESRKQCVEPESTRVGMVIPGTKVEVSWSVKEFGLERADALRHSSTEALTRSTQPWSGARAQGLLPIFLAPWQRSCCLGLVCSGVYRIDRIWADLCSGWPE